MDNDKEIDDKALYLEDYRMTQDRIKHFENILTRIRVGAFPVTAVFIGLAFGFLTFTDAKDISINIHGYNISIASLIFLISGIYFLSMALLDKFYYKLLQRVIEHAKYLEQNIFDNKLQITTKLTSNDSKNLHENARRLLYTVYLIFLGFGLVLLILQSLFNIITGLIKLLS